MVNRDSENAAQVSSNGFFDARLPARYRNHPLVSGTWYYTLPPEMLGQLQRALGDDSFGANILNLEETLSQHAESIGGCVGFFDGSSFSDPYLRPAPPLDLSNPTVAGYLADCQAAGNNAVALSRRINETMANLRIPQKGYLGWLLTNQMFLTELKELHTSYGDLFGSGQRPPQSAAFLSHMQPGNPPNWLRPMVDSTVSAVATFCRRWRLRKIEGPVTFLPLTIQFPVPLPMYAQAQAQESGSLLYIPDIAPLPDRDELRILTEEVVRQTIQHQAHLAEWLELVRSSTLGRKTLTSYADAYSLLHYVRVFYSRHGRLLADKKTKICDSIGHCLGFTADQVRRIKRLLKQRLGDDWIDASLEALVRREVEQ